MWESEPELSTTPLVVAVPERDALVEGMPEAVAEAVADPPPAGTSILRKPATPLLSVVEVFVAAPLEKVHPFDSETVTETPA